MLEDFDATPPGRPAAYNQRQPLATHIASVRQKMAEEWLN
jgi:hypothetical protein